MSFPEVVTAYDHDDFIANFASNLLEKRLSDQEASTLALVSNRSTWNYNSLMHVLEPIIFNSIYSSFRGQADNWDNWNEAYNVQRNKVIGLITENTFWLAVIYILNFEPPEEI